MISEDIAEFGVVYGSQSEAANNYNKVVNAINERNNVVVLGDLYLQPSGATITEDVSIECKHGGRILWVGSGDAFKLQDGLSFNDVGSTHIVEPNNTVFLLKFEQPDGKLNTVQLKDFHIDGSLRIEFEATQTLNPEVKDFGVNYVNIERGYVENCDGSLVFLNSVPYKRVVVRDVHAKNQKGVLVSAPVQNFHTFYDKAKLAMKDLVVDNVTLINDYGFLATPTSGMYAGIVLWEGNRLNMTDTYCEGVVSDSVSVYDVYLAGIHAELNNCEELDCWQFNDSGNTGLKLKKVRNAYVNNKRKWFREDFFTYYKTNFSFDLATSSGLPITLDYTDTAYGENYELENLHIVIPRVGDGARSKATQRVTNFSLKDSTIVMSEGDEPYIIAVLWSPDVPNVSKSIVVTGNTIVTKTVDYYYLVKMTVQDGAPDGGIVDISDNTILAEGGVGELLIASDGLPTALNTTLDSITISNRVMCGGEYYQLKNYNSMPAARFMDFTNSSLITDDETAVLFPGQTQSGANVAQGSMKLTTRNKGRIHAFALHKPATSASVSGWMILSGEVAYDGVIRQFSTNVLVSPDVGLNQIVLKVNVLGAPEQTITWSGSAPNDVVLDIGYDSDEPFRCVLSRYDDYCSIGFDWKSGTEPQVYTLDWKYAHVASSNRSA